MSGAVCARAAPSSSMRATTSPTATFSPSGFRMCTTPLRGAGISIAALSVSSSSSTSSARTLSPSRFAQRTMTPSFTDSPSVGICTSNVAMPSSRSARERRVQEIAFLGLVHLEGARRRARRLRTPNVRERAILREHAMQTPVHRVPRAHVPRLLLHPARLLRLRIGLDDRLELGRGEGVELLHTDDRDGIHRALAARREEIVVDLAATEEQPAHGAALDLDARLRRVAERDVVDDGAEGALRELLERRHAELVPEEALRGHDDERFPEVPVHLPAERVEVLRRRTQVADLHVVLGAELEEALEARARMLGALALVPVREQQDEAARPLPLRLGRRDELIDDDLRPVHEVAELRLPDDETVRVGEARPELEAEHGVRGEHAVEDPELLLRAADVVERDVALVGLHVVEDGVSLAERAACRVLPRHADGDVLQEKRADGERLGAAPVDGLSLADHVPARL